MKADKTLLIKIKSKTERRIMEEPEVKTVIEWNIVRLLTALFALLFLVALVSYFMPSGGGEATERSENVVHQNMRNNETDKADKESAKKVTLTPKKHAETVEVVSRVVSHVTADSDKSQQIGVSNSVAVDPFSGDLIGTPKSQVIASQKKNEEAIKDNGHVVLDLPVASLDSTSANIEKTTEQPNKDSLIRPEQPIGTQDLNAYIVRAQLALSVKNRTPFGQVELPVLVDATKARGVSFFTEIQDMQGKNIYHEWLKEGKSIYKRKFFIYGTRWRFHTSKLMSSTSIGQWQVRAMTEKGQVLHEINFSVESKEEH